MARKAWLFGAPAPGVGKDINDLASVLERELHESHRFQIQSHLDEAANQSALEEILDDIGRWMSGGSPGLLWIGGHGFVADNEHRLLTSDIDREIGDDLKRAPTLTGLWARLAGRVSHSSAKLLVVLDICHSKDQNMPRLPDNIIVLGASGASEVARGARGHGGFLTQALIRALRGHGARPDGVVDLDRIAAAVSAEGAELKNGYQNPWWIHLDENRSIVLNIVARPSEGPLPPYANDGAHADSARSSASADFDGMDAPRKAPAQIVREYRDNILKLLNEHLPLPAHIIQPDHGLSSLPQIKDLLTRAISQFPERIETWNNLAKRWESIVADRLKAGVAATVKFVMLKIRSELLDTIAQHLPSEPPDSAHTGPGRLPRNFARLLSRDPIEEDAALRWLLRKGFTNAENRLTSLMMEPDFDRTTFEYILETLWERWGTIVLEYDRDGLALKLAGFLSKSCPSRFEHRLSAMKKLDSRDITEERASKILRESTPSDRKVLAARLLFHEGADCRRLAREQCPPMERWQWDVLLYRKTQLTLIRETVDAILRYRDRDMSKILFLVVLPRLERARRPEDIGIAYEIMNLFFANNEDFLIEDVFFERLKDLHEKLGKAAQVDLPSRVLLEREAKFFQAFCARDKLPDTGIVAMDHIPLPVQRKLAQDGELPTYFIRSPRDLIAVEAVRHVLDPKRPLDKREPIYFFKLAEINGRALNSLFTHQSLKVTREIKLAFCQHHKAEPQRVEEVIAEMDPRERQILVTDASTPAAVREMAASAAKGVTAPRPRGAARLQAGGAAGRQLAQRQTLRRQMEVTRLLKDIQAVWSRRFGQMPVELWRRMEAADGPDSLRRYLGALRQAKDETEAKDLGAAILKRD